MNPLTAALFIFLFLLPEAWGDDSQPFYIEITEQAPARYQVLWRLPATFKPDNIPRIAMPDVCEAITSVGSAYPGAKLQQRLHCSEPDRMMAAEVCHREECSWHYQRLDATYSS